MTKTTKRLDSLSGGYARTNEALILRAFNSYDAHRALVALVEEHLKRLDGPNGWLGGVSPLIFKSALRAIHEAGK